MSFQFSFYEVARKFADAIFQRDPQCITGHIRWILVFLLVETMASGGAPSSSLARPMDDALSSGTPEAHAKNSPPAAPMKVIVPVGIAMLHREQRTPLGKSPGMRITLADIPQLAFSFRRGYLTFRTDELTLNRFLSIAEAHTQAFGGHTGGVWIEDFQASSEDTLVHLLCFFKQISALKITQQEGTENSSVADTLERVAQRYGNVQRLKLRNSGLDNKKLKRILKSFRNPLALQLLDLRGNSSITKIGVDFATRTFPTLERIRLDGEDILLSEPKQPTSMISLGNLVPAPSIIGLEAQVSTLWIEVGAIGEFLEEIRQCVDTITEKLSRISMCQDLLMCGIGGPIREELYKIFQGVPVRELRSRGDGISPEGGAIVAEALRMSTTLTILDLSSHQYGMHMGDDSVKLLAGALAMSGTLKELSLNANRVGDVGATALAEALKVNTTLKILNLQHNQIAQAGGTALAEALKVNDTLKKLDLLQNAIAESDAAKAFLKALEINTQLRELELGGHWRNQTLSAIQASLVRNKSFVEHHHQRPFSRH